LKEINEAQNDQHENILFRVKCIQSQNRLK